MGQIYFRKIIPNVNDIIFDTGIKGARRVKFWLINEIAFWAVSMLSNQTTLFYLMMVVFPKKDGVNFDKGESKPRRLLKISSWVQDRVSYPSWKLNSIPLISIVGNEPLISSPIWVIWM